MTPRWCYDAAVEIHDRLERISAEAEQSAQVAQDSNVEREEFATAVAGIIEAHFRGTKSAKPRTCPDCGHEYAECNCHEEDEEEREERARCGCPYCFCMNETECGETCSMCLNHAHQG